MAGFFFLLLSDHLKKDVSRIPPDVTLRDDRSRLTDPRAILNMLDILEDTKLGRKLEVGSPDWSLQDKLEHYK